MALYRLTTEIAGREIESFEFNNTPAANEAYCLACWIAFDQFPVTYNLAPLQQTSHMGGIGYITLRRIN